MAIGRAVVYSARSAHIILCAAIKCRHCSKFKIGERQCNMICVFTYIIPQAATEGRTDHISN